MTGWLARHGQALRFALGRLVRAPLATVFTALVIAIALALPAGFLLLTASARAVASGATTVDVTAYFKREVPLTTVQQLADHLRQRSGIAAVEVISADDALAQMRQDSSLAEALGTLPDNPLPHALSIRPTDDASSSPALAALRQYLAAWPEVELVQLDSEWVRRLDAILLLMQRFTLGVGALLGLGVLAVIGNTIRLEINGRRQEIEITQLVGGSAAFVRRPFLYTGALYGLLGALLAAGIVQASIGLIAGPATELARSYGSQFRLEALDGRGLALLLATGAALGLAGAWLAAARHISRLLPRA